jgi:glycosyltransferase involved in cell wall biosynthesis
MKIAILVAALPPEGVGGAEIQAAHMAMHLSKNHQVIVFTRSRVSTSEIDKGQGYLAFRRNFINIPIVRFPLDMLSTLIFLGRYRSQIDVIIAYQTIIDGLIGVIAKKLFNIPVIVSIRAEKEYKIHDFYKSRVFSPFVFKNADKVIVQLQRIRDDLLSEFSKYKEDKLRKILEKKICIIPNGVSSQPLGTTKDNTVLYVGRLIRTKGLEYLISAMKECTNENLLIVGDGPEMRSLKRMARNMNNVDFVGQIPPEEVSYYIQRSQMLALPSLTEGSPNVILEAMAGGIPVISTRIAGIPELVEHGKTGFLTEPGNVEEIAYYIKKLAHDENLRNELGKNCLKEVQQYSWINVLKLLEDELRKIVTQNNKEIKQGYIGY